MKLMLETCGFSHLGIDLNEHCGALMAALLQGARPYEKDWTTHKYSPCGTREEPKGLVFELVPEEKFSDASPLVDKLRDDVKRADKQWVEYFNKYTAAQKEIEELKKKLSEVESVLKPNTEESSHD